MAWSESNVEALWRRSLKERQTTPPFYIFGDKPAEMTDELWQELRAAMSTDMATVQPSNDFLRPGTERAKLHDRRAELSNEALDRFVGTYKKLNGSETVSIRRRQSELWAIYEAGGDYQLLIPISEKCIQVFSYYQSMELDESVGGQLELKLTSQGTTTTWIAV